MTDELYLIELKWGYTGISPGNRTPLGFNLVDLMFEAVPADFKPPVLPIQVMCRLTDPEKLPDHLSDSHGFHLVSERMRHVMAPFLKDTVFHPAVVETTKPGGMDTDIGGGPVIEGYWWMQCCRLLDLVKWDQSEVSERRTFPAQYEKSQLSVRFVTWRKLALKALPPDEHCFGVIGLEGGRRFLSDRFWRAMLESGLKFHVQPMFLDAALPTEARHKVTAEMFNAHYRAGWVQ